MADVVSHAPAFTERQTPLLPPVPTALLVWALLALASFMWVRDNELQRRSRLVAQTTQVGEAQVQALKSTLERNLYVLDITAALVQQGAGQVPRFDAIAPQLLKTRPGVRALALLPQGGQRVAMYSENHDRALGLDAWQLPLVAPAATAGSPPVLGGGWRLSLPVVFANGRKGLVAEVPVHLSAPSQADAAQLWGHVRAVIDVGDWLQDSHLNTLRGQGFEHRLLAGDEALSTDWADHHDLPDALVLPVALYNQAWRLQIAPVSGWVSPFALAWQVVWAVLFSVGGGLLVYVLLRNLRATQGTLSQLASQVPGVLYQYRRRADGHTSFSYISPGALALTGFAPLSLRESDADWRASLLPEDRQQMREALERSAKDLTPLVLDFRQRSAQGDIRWFWTKALPQREADGAVVWNGYMADWTQEKQTQEALVQSGQMLLEAQEVARLGCFITDVSTGHWTSSSLLDKLFGIDATFAHTAKGWFELVEPEHRESLRLAYQAAVTNRSGFQVEYAIRRPADDRVVWVQAMGRLEFDAGGQPTRIVGTVQDITARKKAEAEIRSLAFYDPLTGLPNRRLLLDRLAQTLELRQNDHAHGALMFIDLDNFKDLNDTLGHDKGDALLRMVALRLLACVSEADTVCRLGGDEFVLLLSRLELAEGGPPAEVAESVGLKVLSALSRPYPLAGMSLTSTPSIGVALFGDEGLAVDEVLKRADVAMYQAKAAGRNTLRFYDPAIQAEMAERMQLAEDLRRALTAGELHLVYQPQHDETGHLVGAEALLRWKHPTRGPISPAVFIPLAEQVGLMSAVGQWVLHQACQQLAVWLADAALVPALAPGFSLAVNVSAHQFRSPEFVSDIGRVLAQSGIPPHTLKLELTESLMVHDVEDIIAKMNAVRPMHVLFSLDDFGTGYSSLTYLKRLPLDQLKIDQSFVRDVQTSSNDAAIARTVLALGQTLGLHVIAEGVETRAQRSFLHDMGCHAYQGYLFSKPLSAPDFKAYALSHQGVDLSALG